MGPFLSHFARSLHNSVIYLPIRQVGLGLFGFRDQIYAIVMERVEKCRSSDSSFAAVNGLKGSIAWYHIVPSKHINNYEMTPSIDEYGRIACRGEDGKVNSSFDTERNSTISCDLVKNSTRCRSISP
uniref:Uncharacterized protein n=1 Tax=Glossina austeni TaxID=7395 RepID=A0A1A9V7F9_GLOAU